MQDVQGYYSCGIQLMQSAPIHKAQQLPAMRLEGVDGWSKRHCQNKVSRQGSLLG